MSAIPPHPMKTKRARVSDDNRVSTCKRCLTGIFKDRDLYVWQIRPVPGFVHDHCLPGSGHGLAGAS